MSRSTRAGRQQVEEAAASTDAPEEAGQSSWQQEVDSIFAGTHPLLVAELKKHEQEMQKQIAQSQRICNHQTQNIRNLFECEKKQIEDEYQASLDFFQQRLIDSIEQKQRKAARQTGFNLRRPSETGKPPEKRAKLGLATSSENLVLKPEEMKSDIDEILRNVDHYSVRTAAMASDDLRHNTGDVWYDRGRHVLHCCGHALERGTSVSVYQHGQRVDDRWTITAMNAVEVTLRDVDGSKLKVTLSQLRNGRFAFRRITGMGR